MTRQEFETIRAVYNNPGARPKQPMIWLQTLQRLIAHTAELHEADLGAKVTMLAVAKLYGGADRTVHIPFIVIDELMKNGDILQVGNERLASDTPEGLLVKVFRHRTEAEVIAEQEAAETAAIIAQGKADADANEHDAAPVGTIVLTD